MNLMNGLVSPFLCGHQEISVAPDRLFDLCCGRCLGNTMSKTVVGLLGLVLMFCLCPADSSQSTLFPKINLSTNGTLIIPLVCQATRYTELCASSLSSDSRSSRVANSTELVRVAIDLGWIHQQDSIALIRGFQNSSSFLDVNFSSPALVCGESLDYGSARLASSRDTLLVKPLQDTQAWLSAALQFQYDCVSALSNVVNPPERVTDVIVPQVNLTMQLISNALCMTDALAVYGSAPSGWLPLAETRPANLSSVLTYISPEWMRQVPDVQHSILSDLRPNATVSLDGLSSYTTVQEAVDIAPSYSNERYVVYIKEGIYSETVRVHQNKTRITFVGDGADKTILTGNNNASTPGVATYQTASVVVAGDGFIGMGITFQNTAGPTASQAVAIRVDSDVSVFQDCSFDGYQDTLYAHTGRQFYSNCSITGTTDFIFGNSAAVFRNCRIAVRLNRPSVFTSTITAHGRTDPGQTTGFVFQNCTVTSSPDYVEVGHKAYLGRPWKLFSRTVFVSTFMDSLITSSGWLPWSGDFASDSLLFGEYDSYGPGAANVSSRVPWSNQLTGDQAQYFSVDNFIQGSWWFPITN